MCFCETNRIQNRRKLAWIVLIVKVLRLAGWGFSIRFVWREIHGSYEVDFGL